MSDTAPSSLTSANFDGVASRGVVVVDFWAVWCGPCQRQAPVFEKVAQQLGQYARFAKVDIDAEPQLAARFRVTSIPTLMVLKDGVPVDGSVGLTSEEALAAMVRRALGIA